MTPMSLDSIARANDSTAGARSAAVGVGGAGGGPVACVGGVGIGRVVTTAGADGAASCRVFWIGAGATTGADSGGATVCAGFEPGLAVPLTRVSRAVAAGLSCLIVRWT